jgi:hypothetical protein
MPVSGGGGPPVGPFSTPAPVSYTGNGSLGRISGKLLSANLIRDGVDLTFRNGPTDPDLVYFDVTGNKLGFNTDNPLYDLDVNGLLDTNILSITTTATIGNVKINADGSLSTVTGPLNIVPTAATPPGPGGITVGPAPTGISLTSDSVTLDKSFYSQSLVDSLVGQTAVVDRYPAAPLFYTVVSIETEPLNPTQWRMTVDTTFNPAGQLKPISFYPDTEITQIITNDIWDTTGNSVGEKWVAWYKTNLPGSFNTTVQPGWSINVAGTIYIVDYVVEDPINTNMWRIYVTTSLVAGVGIPIFSSDVPSSYYDAYISHARLTTSLLQINDNFISANVTDGNVIFDPNGSGAINLQSSVVNTGGIDVTGNINIQGNLSYGGSLILGDAAADALDFNGEFDNALLPGVDNYYNLGAPGKAWALLRVANAEIGSLSQNSILVDNKLYIANSANDITATQGNDPIYINPDTRVIYLEDFKIENNIITNQLNTPVTFTSTGTGYLQFTDTNAFIIPVGDNSQRGFTEVGETRWNTQEGYMECFDGTVYYVATGPGEFLTPEDMDALGNLYSLILG